MAHVMADTKLSALTELTTVPADDDEFYLRDVSESAANESKKILAKNVRSLVQQVDIITGASASGSTTVPFDDTIPQIDEGVEYMTLAITPKSTDNRLIIMVVVQGGSSHDAIVTAMLFQDDDANALAVGAIQELGGKFQEISFIHVMDAGTELSTTFRVRVGTNASATYTFNGNGTNRYYGGKLASSIVILEVTK